MNIPELVEQLNRGETVEGGSEAHQAMHQASQEALKVTAELNAGYQSPEKIRELISTLINKPVDESFAMFPPFSSDFGRNIKIGKNVFINSGCRFQDQGGITLGDGVLVGHNVVIATLNHDMNPANRGTMHPAPVNVGDNVWIGANATILPGVTIGNGAIIAAGAVVSKNVDANVVVGGVPAQQLKEIDV